MSDKVEQGQFEGNIVVMLRQMKWRPVLLQECKSISQKCAAFQKGVFPFVCCDQVGPAVEENLMFWKLHVDYSAKGVFLY